MVQANAILGNLGFTKNYGLCHTYKDAQNNAERLYMMNAKKLEVNAVFFRRFFKIDASIAYHSLPAVCIFHKSDNFFNSPEHIKLHAALWSASKIEIYILFTANRVDIINARKPAKRISETNVSLNDVNLLLASQALEKFNDQRFSAHLFGSGTFWEQSTLSDKIDTNSSPYLFLLDYLMNVRRKLSNNYLKLEAATIDKLLVVSIFIKFLEEIKDDNGKHTLKQIYDLNQVDSFAEALEKGLCLNILNELTLEFNGKVFDTFSSKEKAEITTANLAPIAKFLHADIELDTNQLFLWKQYDFKHLPAEVISAIYENFIQEEALRKGKNEKGVVYTPIHLVELLIDEVMPLDQPELFNNGHFKILDPACGSGVFLVAAYKRLLQWWTIKQYNKTNQIVYPDKAIAQKILEDNIFGVDIEETATFVSIFGLTIALLDKLTPKEIWNNLKFQNLSERNISRANFKDWATIAKSQEAQFDLVIGNPPFNASSKGDISSEEVKKIFGKVVPGNKLALKFLEAALYFGKQICMIIPANVFLYNKSKTTAKYRTEIFTQHTVEKIYDFTHLRESLFTKKSPKGFGTQKKTGRTPVIGLIAYSQSSNYQSIEHIIVKREFSSEKKVRFEIDYYDRHQIRWDWATNEKMQFIWKTNLLGGGRLFNLIYRLSLVETLGGFLKKKEKEKSWVYQNGYITSRKYKKKTTIDPLTGKQNKSKYKGKIAANFITEKQTIKPKSFTEYGEYEKIIELEKSFLWPRRKELFEPPHIVLQLVLAKSKIPMAFVEEYLCFNSSFVGISAPKEEKKELYKVYDRLFKNEETSKLYQAFILSAGSKALVYHETSITKEDFNDLPFPENIDLLDTSPTEKIIIDDVVNYYRHLGKAISKNSTGKILHEVISKIELQEFGKTYCETLNEIYAKDGQSWQIGQVIQTPSFVKYQFGFGKDGGLSFSYKEGALEEITALIQDDLSNRGSVHKRIARYYEHVNGYDCVSFIKPNSKRYWLQSIALRDADDTFMDLKQEGF